MRGERSESCKAQSIVALKNVSVSLALMQPYKAQPPAFPQSQKTEGDILLTGNFQSRLTAQSHDEAPLRHLALNGIGLVWERTLG